MVKIPEDKPSEELPGNTKKNPPLSGQRQVTAADPSSSFFYY